MLIPYPVVRVDRGYYLSRSKEPGDLERLWIDYVTELSREAEADPTRGATVVAIGIHPFVVGTPPVRRHCAVCCKTSNSRSLSG